MDDNILDTINTSIIYLKSFTNIVEHLDEHEQMYIHYRLQDFTSKLDEFIILHQDKLKENFNLNHLVTDATDKTIDTFLPYMLLYQIFRS